MTGMQVSAKLSPNHYKHVVGYGRFARVAVRIRGREFEEAMLSLESIANVRTNAAGALPGFDLAPNSPEVYGNQKDGQGTVDRMCRPEEGTRDARLDTPISDPPTSRSRFSCSSSTSLLGTFYRLSTPNKVPSFSETDLVSYFQNEVCPLLSVFDSDANPFQTIVAELGTSSRTVNLAMQSMAIGHLANHYPYMAPVGLSKRWQAWRSLQQDLAAYRRDRLSLEKILISILLLGSTSVWHPGPSQGPQYLLIARNIMQKHLQERTGSHTTSLLHEDFFQNCLVYWEQTMSFVDPTVTMPSFPGFGAPALCKPNPRTPVHPHPWTGISPEVHFATAEVGRVLRRRQRFSNSHIYHDSEHRWAESLEEYLYTLEFPTIDDICDFGDSNTSKSDLVRMAEAFRFFGLLELYALYPELLSKRLQSTSSFAALGIESGPDIDDQGNQACWLTHIALHMIDTIKVIPISSGASRNQVAILVTVSSHLRLMDGDHGRDSDQILSARYFVESSLLNLARKYAQRPAAQAIDVVKEVWARLDTGSPGEHWMTVAHEKRWLSFLG